MKALADFPGYSITEHGKVFSHPKKVAKGQWLKLHPAGRSRKYLNASFYVNGNRKTVLVHQLVYKTYVGPLTLGLQINHRDGNPQNNHYSNLEEVTPSENILHWYHVLRKKS